MKAGLGDKCVLRRQHRHQSLPQPLNLLLQRMPLTTDERLTDW